MSGTQIFLACVTNTYVMQSSLLSSGFVLPGKPERALKHEFIPKRGGPPEFKYCQGESRALLI